MCPRADNACISTQCFVYNVYYIIHYVKKKKKIAYELLSMCSSFQYLRKNWFYILFSLIENRLSLLTTYPSTICCARILSIIPEQLFNPFKKFVLIFEGKHMTSRNVWCSPKNCDKFLKTSLVC